MSKADIKDAHMAIFSSVYEPITMYKNTLENVRQHVPNFLLVFFGLYRNQKIRKKISHSNVTYRETTISELHQSPFLSNVSTVLDMVTEVANDTGDKISNDTSGH